MRRKICLTAILFVLLFLQAGCANQGDFIRKDGNLILEEEGIRVVLDEQTGMLKEFSSGDDSIGLKGVVADAGLNGAYAFRQLGYTDFSSLSTWELPLLWPKMKELPEYCVDSIKRTKEGFQVSVSRDIYTFLYDYQILDHALSLSVTLSTTSEEDVYVNGFAFLIQGLSGYDLSDTTFEFPGSTPDGRIPFVGQSRYRAVSADYASPVIQLTDSVRTTNLLFVNETEKWTAGCYSDADGLPCAAFLSAVEGIINRERPMEVGTLYLPLLQDGQDPYLAVSDFWEELGYHIPRDSSGGEDLWAVYSAHPYGTMDTGYWNRLTLEEYADSLSAISEMGFSAVWLLPVFQHTGDNVYEPIDQGIIDQRYGGLEQARSFIQEAHAQGVKALFDFVPHGPRPVYPFAKEHDDWVSKDREGNNQIEWECVSMDYNHPEYYAYNVELAKYYAEEISLDGARIDCSMGGLSNWSSAAGLRASASGLAAGLNVVKALREGFIAGGKEPLLLPENFHPSPAYAEYTDVFYDMPLYRCLYSMGHSDLTETQYVSRLAHFLEAEQKTSVAGQRKLRFLGNHDTVTWTFDAQRAQTLYGVEKAKALWMIMGWIDGVLYIYQGDEDPAAYGLEGMNLTEFFTELLDAKKTYLPMDYLTRYISTESPVFAFYRYDRESADARLVLVNLSGQSNSYTPENGESQVLAAIGDYTQEDGSIILAPYSGVILQSGQ